MLVRTVKLKLNKAQEQRLDEWLWHLTGVYNWGVRKIELDAKDGIFYSKMCFRSLVDGCSKRVGVAGHTIQGTLERAWLAWDRCFKKIGKKPRFKGKRNKLTSIIFPDPPKLNKDGKVKLNGFEALRLHKQDFPEGKWKRGLIVKRASGWYLCIWIDAKPSEIAVTNSRVIGIDPGFKTLLTTSDGEVFKHPRELEKMSARLAQAQRSGNKKRAARVQERIANVRKDRNHKLSHQMVAECSEIYFSKDNLKGLSKVYGKSVASSGHAQLRSMLAYKSALSGRKYVEVASRHSTKTCSTCGALSGPSGRHMLKVRHWVCGCGAQHDRDQNAAMNTLIAGLGLSHERRGDPVSENSKAKRLVAFC